LKLRILKEWSSQKKLKWRLWRYRDSSIVPAVHIQRNPCPIQRVGVQQGRKCSSTKFKG